MFFGSFLKISGKSVVTFSSKSVSGLEFVILYPMVMIRSLGKIYRKSYGSVKSGSSEKFCEFLEFSKIFQNLTFKQFCI